MPANAQPIAGMYHTVYMSTNFTLPLSVLLGPKLCGLELMGW